MAAGKKSFILYADLIGTVEQMPDNKAGLLFKTILQYVNDQNPEVKDLLVKVAFEPVKLQLKRDLVKWEKQHNQRVEAGIKSAEKRKESLNENQRPLTTVDDRITPVNEKEHPSTVNVTATVTVNDNVIKEGEAQNEILPPTPKKETNILPINTYRKIKHLILSNEEFEKLAVNYSKEQIDDILDAIENYKDNKKYTSLFFTANKWLKKEYPANSKTYHQPQDKKYF